MAKKKDEVKEEEKILLWYAIKSQRPISDQSVISNLFLKVYDSQRSVENAYYKSKICGRDGVEVKSIKIAHKYKNKRQEKVKEVDEVALHGESLVKLMGLIQSKKIGYFSSIKMYAQERSIEYSGNFEPRYLFRYHDARGPPSGVTPIEGRHYFLDLILGEPGKKVKLAKRSPVKACKACDAMLLRYTYNWVVQCDDLSEKACPYCKKPLEIIERDRKYVEVMLDFNAKDCNVTDTNSQIGILYRGRPIKATVKVASLRNFFMNFQNLFPARTIGPLDVAIDIVKSRKGFNLLKTIEPSSPLGEIEWRPVVLFPEDLIAY